MQAIGEVLRGWLMPAAPFLAVALLGYGAHLVSKHRSSKPADSPWLWLGAFSLVGLIGLWAISPKYDDRQKRLEARYEARQRIAQRRPFAASSDGGEATQAARSVDIAEDSPDDAQMGYGNERRVPLGYLAAGLLLAATGSLVMLKRSLAADAESQ